MGLSRDSKHFLLNKAHFRKIEISDAVFRKVDFRVLLCYDLIIKFGVKYEKVYMQ